MAIRVRKLAKEVRRSPGEVLGLLHHLGYVNYKRPDDMVADTPADKLRKAVKRGVVAPPLSVAERARPSALLSSMPAGEDLMAQLVPGVIRKGQGSAPVVPASRPSAPAAPAAPAPTPLPDPGLAQAVAELSTARDALTARVSHLETQLAEAHEAAAAAVAALDGVRSVPVEGVPVGELVEARGLRGRDEGLRAIEALLAARGGQGLLSARLDAAGVAELQRELQGLMLLDGPPPSELTVPAIAVSDDRAEAPGGPTLDRQLHDLSEHMLLSGWRRLALVGVPTRWHEAIGQRLDRRVEVSFRPAGPWTPAQVANVQADLVGAVGLEAPDEAVESSSAVWVREDSLSSLLRRLVSLARGDDAGR